MASGEGRPYSVSERWGRLSLVVHRGQGNSSQWTLVWRQTDGKRVWDRRLAWGSIDTAPGSSSSVDPLEALAAALADARERRARG